MAGASGGSWLAARLCILLPQTFFGMPGLMSVSGMDFLNVLASQL
jgi:hypothetical protein